jgi:hypothetical protein
VLAQAVTTVWGTKLGTKLLNGFNSTTDDTAYFRCLLLHPGSLESTMAPSSSPVWSRHPGRLLLSPRAPSLSQQGKRQAKRCQHVGARFGSSQERMVVLLEWKTAGWRHDNSCGAFARTRREIYIGGVARAESDAKVIVQILARKGPSSVVPLKKVMVLRGSGLPQ